jgi:hypothetical protein
LVESKEMDRWDLCADTSTSKKEWICAISTAIGQPCGEEKEESKP